MEQIQNNRVITDLYRENAQFPGIALDGSDVYLCWQRFVDRFLRLRRPPRSTL